MNKRAVRRIHQTDNSVIDGAGEIGRQVSQFVFLAENRNPGRGKGRLNGLGESGSRRWWFGNVDPDEVVMLFAGIAPGIDAVDLQFLIGSEGGDELALASMSIKPPAVVAAFHLLPIENATRKRHATVGAGVMQCERPALAVPSDCQGSFEQHGFA